MTWWQNLPLFQIVCPLMCAAVCSVLKGKAARAVMTALSVLECVCMGILLYYTSMGNFNYVYAMGEIGAPFGNELRIGVTEALVGLAFSLFMLCTSCDCMRPVPGYGSVMAFAGNWGKAPGCTLPGRLAHIRCRSSCI